MAGEKLLDIQESAWNKTHADFLWNVIEFQGECLVWKVRRKIYIPDAINKRGTVRGFSRSSRLRLMRAFARIDWEKSMPMLFITLTYPDDVLLRDRWLEQTDVEKKTDNEYQDLCYLHLSQHRWVFWKFLEQYMGRKCCGIWRIEWKPRQSGNRQGKPMPHIHILLLDTPYYPWQECRWSWMKTIGERFANIDVRAVYDRNLAVSYISKYLGKHDDDTLEDDAYLDSIPPGRCWGWMRKNLVPKGERFIGRFFETDQIASLRHYAVPGKVELIDAGMCSFTLIGVDAAEIGSMLFGQKLDGEVESL